MTYGLIGEKLGHSYSKKIHESFNKYSYDLIELDSTAFITFMEARKFDGINVTIPYKKSVIPFCDLLTPIAKTIGSVNTIYYKNGILTGDNTDYYGFIYMVNRAGISFKNRKVLVLGNGGSSLMVVQAAKDLGAGQVIVTSRSGTDGSVPFSHLNKHHDSEIIINATPVGMYPLNGDSLVSLKDFPLCEGVIDLIYNPLITHLLSEAKASGVRYTNGLSMLVAQASKAFEIFTGTILKEADVEAAILSLEKEIKNIILIGMPGSGKTTIGKKLSQMLSRQFVDTDSLVELESGMSIPMIFEKYGEKYFRDKEALVSLEAGKGNGKIISTGGGIILNPLNMDSLSQNGTVIFLNRPFEKLEQKGRPLSRSLDSLLDMASERMPLYKKYCDYIINVTEDPDENVDAIIKILGGK